MAYIPGRSALGVYVRSTLGVRGQSDCTIDTVDPTEINTDFRVKIIGKGFGSEKGSGTVRIDSVLQTVEVWTDEEIIIDANVDSLDPQENSQVVVTTDSGCVAAHFVTRAPDCPAAVEERYIYVNSWEGNTEPWTDGGYYTVSIDPECYDFFARTCSTTSTAVDEVTTAIDNYDYDTAYAISAGYLGTVISYQTGNSPSEVAQDLADQWNADDDMAEAYVATVSGVAITLTSVDELKRVPVSEWDWDYDFGTGSWATPQYTDPETVCAEPRCRRNVNIEVNMTYPCGLTLGAAGAGFEFPAHGLRQDNSAHRYWKSNTTAQVYVFNLPKDGSIVGCTLWVTPVGPTYDDNNC